MILPAVLLTRPAFEYDVFAFALIHQSVWHMYLFNRLSAVDISRVFIQAMNMLTL